MEDPAAGPSTLSSFSAQDDPQAQHIREQLTKYRESLVSSLKKIPLRQLLRKLYMTHVITRAEADYVGRKPGQHQASTLIDVVSHKIGTQLKIFSDTLKMHCPSAYRLLREEEDPVGSKVYCHKAQQDAEFADEYLTTVDQLGKCIYDSHYGPFKFFHLCRSLISNGTDLTEVTFENGFNLMHEVIREGRLDLLKIIQYTGIWTKLYSQHTEYGDGQFSNLTPLQYATKQKNTKFVVCLNEINAHETSLSEVEICIRAGNVSEFKDMKQRIGYQLSQRMSTLPMLEYACQSGVLEMLQEVLKSRHEYPSMNPSVEKAIKLCIELGHHHMLQTLFALGLVDIEHILIQGRTCIEFAASNGDIKTFQELKELDVPVAPTVISIAASKNRLPFLREIFAAQQSFHDINFQDKRMKTAGHFAAEKGHVEVLRLLLEKGLDITLKDKRGYSLLHSAASGGNLEAVELILTYCRYQDYLHTMLHSQDHYLGADRCHLVRGRDKDNPAWHYLKVDRGLLDIFRKKMGRRALDVTKYGTVLKSGWGANPPEAVVNAVEAKFDVFNVKPDAPLDMQPLHVAILKNHQDIALSPLIEVMTDVTKPDRFGLTPLHLAAMRGSHKVIEGLLKKGANARETDSRGRTPHDIAKANEQYDVLPLLLPGYDPQREVIRGKLQNAYQSLSTENIEQLGMDEDNLTSYTRNVLKDVVADINDYVYDCLGGGPVTSESMEPMYN